MAASSRSASIRFLSGADGLVAVARGLLERLLAGAYGTPRGDRGAGERELELELELFCDPV